MKKATVSAPIMNENRNFHHFLNMSSRTHVTIIATNVRSDEIAQKCGVVKTHLMGINSDAAKSTGNSHQNLLMKFFIVPKVV